jgi:threonine dehydrogenase-like Zn-dependent dehydrogenase
MPIPQPGEILIRLEVCLLCTEQAYSAAAPACLPYIPWARGGRRGSPDTSRVRNLLFSGDRVVINVNHCGHCDACYRGDDNQCTGVRKRPLL